MSCLELEKIYDYLEKEMPEEERARVEEHLKSCSSCKKALTERQLFLSAINGIPRLEPPEEFTSQVMASLPDLRRPKTWLIFLVGGVYFLFSLFIILCALTFEIKSLSWTWEIFKRLFTLVLELSRLILLILKYLQAMGRSLIIIMKVVINFMAGLVPPFMTLALSALGIVISMVLGIYLIKKVLLTERS